MRFHALPALVGNAMLMALAIVGVAPIAGCSSPSRGPETDVVEVERIEVAPPAPTPPVPVPASE
jgi:hypothetical protein